MSDHVTTKSGSSVEKALFGEKMRFLLEGLSKQPIRVAQSAGVNTVLAEMCSRRSGGVLVTADADAERLVGIFTERDYIDKLVEGGGDRNASISDFMTPAPTTLTPDDTVGAAIQVMTGGGYRHVPIVENERIYNLVSVRDIVNFIAEHFPEEVYNHPPILDQQPNTQEGG